LKRCLERGSNVKLVKRLVLGQRLIRIYDKGGILLSEPGETLEKMSGGEFSETSPEGAKIKGCLFCGQPSLYWGLFMTGEEAEAYLEKQDGQASGAFFGFCRDHSPYVEEDKVCDEAYAVMVSRLTLKKDFALAETVVNAWLDELAQEGYSRVESLETVYSLIQVDKLTQYLVFPEEVKRAMEVALKAEIWKESN